jgi:hypothetical protein
VAKGRKRRKGETFGTEVRRQFGPVADRLGLAELPGNRNTYSGVRYVLDGLHYSWGVDPREGYMWVHIILDRHTRYSCGLADLVAKHRSDTEAAPGRLDVRPRKRSGAEPVVLLGNTMTWLVLQRAVASHALWVERFHPRLVAPDAPELILDAGGKLVMPDAFRWRPGSS